MPYRNIPVINGRERFILSPLSHEAFLEIRLIPVSVPVFIVPVSVISISVSFTVFPRIVFPGQSMPGARFPFTVVPHLAPVIVVPIVVEIGMSALHQPDGRERPKSHVV